MTRRLYYDDSYQREFQASVEAPGTRIFLDHTAFYPTSGGQPFDTGRIGAARVLDVIDEEDRIAHVLDQPLEPGEYSCAIDWSRRFDHMQQHTGQHLLSAVLMDVFEIPTVSFHLGVDDATIDVESAAFTPAQILEAERRANQAIFENRPVTVSYHDAREPIGLRKPSEREGIIRVVSIDGLDKSACGGTHVRSTAEIGPLFIRKLDKIRGNIRIEFVCGLRAVSRARADFDGFSEVARAYSCSLEDAPQVALRQVERLADAEKLKRKLSLELAQLRGRELFAATAPNPNGLRIHIRRLATGPIEDDLRTEAQAFTAGGKALYLVTCADPASVLFAAAPDSGLKAGPALKPLLEKRGGRGGGSPQLAQGSLPNPADLPGLEQELLGAL